MISEMQSAPLAATAPTPSPNQSRQALGSLWTASMRTPWSLAGSGGRGGSASQPQFRIFQGMMRGDPLQPKALTNSSKPTQSGKRRCRVFVWVGHGGLGDRLDATTHNVQDTRSLSNMLALCRNNRARCSRTRTPDNTHISPSGITGAKSRSVNPPRICPEAGGCPWRSPTSCWR